MKHPLVICAFLVTVAFAQNLCASAETALEGVLFNQFIEIRDAQERQEISVAKYFSRAWLERSISSAFRAMRPEKVSELNWVADSLLTSFSAGSTVEKIYAYSVSMDTPDSPQLALQISGCRGPSTLTIGYVYEEGAWRISSIASDSTSIATSWFKKELEPIRTFKRIPMRDRSAYFNESPMGKSVGLNVQHQPCE